MARYVGVQLCDQCDRYRACMRFDRNNWGDNLRVCQECLVSAADTIDARQDEEARRRPE
jgi:hypothetical protein